MIRLFLFLSLIWLAVVFLSSSILFLYVNWQRFKSVCCWTMNERTQWRRFGGKVLKYASRCFSRYGREHYRPNSFVMISTEQLKAYWTCFSANCYTMFYKISQMKRGLRKKLAQWSVHYIYMSFATISFINKKNRRKIVETTFNSVNNLFIIYITFRSNFKAITYSFSSYLHCSCTCYEIIKRLRLNNSK